MVKWVSVSAQERIMDLFSQYENMQVIAEGEAKTFRARQAATHRPVLLHQLSSNPRSGRRLHLLALVLRYMSSRRSGGPSPILGIEEQGDSVWVITDDLPELTNLWEWMERESGKKAGSETVSPPAAPVTEMFTSPHPPSGNPPATLDEKTVLFATRLAAADSSPLVDLDATAGNPSLLGEQEKSHAIAGPGPVPGSGDVTRFFSAIPESGSDAQRSKAPGLSGAEDSAAPGLNDSTLILQTPAEQRAVPPAASSTPPGEFTAIFRTPSAQDVHTQSAPQQPSGESTLDPSENPGDFTMLFRKTPGSSPGSEQKPRFMGFTAPTQEKAKFIETSYLPTPQVPVQPEPSPPPPETSPQAGDFTMIFGPPAAGVPGKTLAPSPGIPDFAGPKDDDQTASPQAGEFTQVFQHPQTSRNPSLQSEEQHEPGAFTRIFQIPVGSDLLTAAEPQTAFSHPAAPSAPPLWQNEVPGGSAAGTPKGAPANPASPPAGGWPGIPGVQIKPPAAAVDAPKLPPPPSALKPAVPPMPKIEVPHAPPVAVPKAPAFATPKAPNFPGLEKSTGKPGPSIVPLILILGGIALVAVLIVLFFVTKH